MLPGNISVKVTGYKRENRAGVTGEHKCQGNKTPAKKKKNASAENCGLIRYYAPSSGEFLPTFRDNLSVPPSRVKNPWILLNS